MITPEQHEDWLQHPVGKIGKSEYCDVCGRFNSRTLAANALVIDGTKVLLVQRGEKPYKGWWDIPGGYLGWDETVEDCASRELHEETGLIVDPMDLDFFSVFSDPNNKANNQVVDLYFITRKFSGEIIFDSQEIVAAEWFNLNELPDSVAFDHLFVLEKLQKKLHKK